MSSAGPLPVPSDEHGTVRITALDTTRATEDTAILLALLLGRLFNHSGRPQADVPISKKLAWGGMLGYLRMAHPGNVELAYSHADLLADGHFADENDSTTARKLEAARGRFREFYDSVQLRISPQYSTDMCYVVSPVDGVTACHRGLAGAISVLAGGDRGSLLQPKHPWYLVVAVAPGRIRTPPSWDPNPVVSTHAGPDTVAGVLATVLDDLFEKQVPPGNRASFSISTLLPLDGTDPLAPVCGKHSRVRISTGSPVAGALAVYAFNPTFDLFTAVVSGVQAGLIAVASRATGGVFYALPVADPVAKGGRCEHGAVGPDHFVRADADVFLNATAVSHSAVLEGVRFDEMKDTVTTQTLSLRSRTLSQRRVAHTHHLFSQKRFHFYEGGGNPVSQLSLKDLRAKYLELDRVLG